MLQLARALGLPTGNARQISEAFNTTSSFLFGPESRSEIIEETRDRIVERVTECILLNQAREFGLDPDRTALEVCKAYRRSSVKSLNRAYTQWFNTSMCTGDPYCESVIARWK